MSAMLTFPAQAAAPFVPPEGCRLEMTVQARGCSVAQHFRCEGDPPGTQHAIHFGQAGPRHHGIIDSETRWIETRDPETGIVDRLEPGAADDASFTTLLATGRDDFDFWTVADDGFRLHHVGFDELTGEVVTIDGVRLERTRFHLTTTDADGNEMWTREGGQFISRAQRRFYGGVETGRDWTGKVSHGDDSPVDFAFPGEAGFGATTPRYDCEMLTSQAEGAAAPAALRAAPPPISGQG